MESVCLDTTFLIDLQRSSRNTYFQRAATWLSNHPRILLKVPSIVLGEFSAGFEEIDHPEILAIYQRHEILPITTKEALLYGNQYRTLKTNGQLIGSNDLWIAATALANQWPLVTRNVSHFQKIPSLELVDY